MMPQPDNILIEHASDIGMLKEKFENLQKTVEKDMKPKLDELHSIMTQAKGARWAIVSVAGLAGALASLLASKVGAILTILFK